MQAPQLAGVVDEIVDTTEGAVPTATVDVDAQPISVAYNVYVPEHKLLGLVKADEYPPGPDQLYVVPPGPLVVIEPLQRLQDAGDGDVETTGGACTVTVANEVAVQPDEAVPVTV